MSTNLIKDAALHFATHEPDRVVACYNACAGIDDPSVVPDLLSALKDLFQMMDEKILVRNIEHDHKPEWAGMMMGLVTRLKFAHDAIERAEGRKP